MAGGANVRRGTFTPAKAALKPFSSRCSRFQLEEAGQRSAGKTRVHALGPSGRSEPDAVVAERRLSQRPFCAEIRLDLLSDGLVLDEQPRERTQHFALVHPAPEVTLKSQESTLELAELGT